MMTSESIPVALAALAAWRPGHSLLLSRVPCGTDGRLTTSVHGSLPLLVCSDMSELPSNCLLDGFECFGILVTHDQH